MKNKLKKAYHTGKLSQYLDSLLAEGVKIDEKKIKKELKKFEKERDELVKKFKKYINKEITPTVEVLYDEKATEEEKENYKKQSEYATSRAKSILLETAKSVARKSDIDIQKFTEYAHELTGLTYFLDQDVVFKKRNWKIDQMRLMEHYDCSRKEAEDHSYIMNSYIEYKNAYNLRHNVENFIINARKQNY